MIVGRGGKLYMTEVVTNTISKWDPDSQDFLGSRTVMAQDNVTMIWPDTVAIDEQGYLWASTRYTLAQAIIGNRLFYSYSAIFSEIGP